MTKFETIILAEYFDEVENQILPNFNLTLVEDESDRDFGVLSVAGANKDVRLFVDFLNGDTSNY